MSLVTGTFEKQAPGRVILLCFGAKHFAFKVPLYNSGMEMFNSKFSGKPKEMLLCDEPGSHPRKEVGVGGGEEGNIRYSLSLYAKETGISLSQMGHLA